MTRDLLADERAWEAHWGAHWIIENTLRRNPVLELANLPVPVGWASVEQPDGRVVAYDPTGQASMDLSYWRIIEEAE